MGYLDSLNITGSALTAERFRTDIIMQNLANQNTTRTAEGGPYKRKQVVFRENTLNFKSELGKAMTKAENGGVFVEEVVESQNPSVPVYDPDHPDADEDGYVMMPNVNSAEEMVDLMAASRAYERFRTDIIMQNLANQNTTRTAEGGPYKRKQVVFRENTLNFKSELGKAMTKAENGGVFVEEVVESQNPSVPVYDPDHPDADEDGYVMMPNVNSAEEMVDLMAASRAYEANVTALNVAKSMALKALEIGK